jgi:hypothetical protein
MVSSYLVTSPFDFVLNNVCCFLLLSELEMITFHYDTTSYNRVKHGSPEKQVLIWKWHLVWNGLFIAIKVTSIVRNIRHIWHMARTGPVEEWGHVKRIVVDGRWLARWDTIIYSSLEQRRRRKPASTASWDGKTHIDCRWNLWLQYASERIS